MSTVIRRKALVTAVLVGCGLFAALPALAASSAINSWSFNEVDGSQAIDSVGRNTGFGAGDSLPSWSADVPFSDRGNTGSMSFSGENHFKVGNSLSGDFPSAPGLRQLRLVVSRTGKMHQLFNQKLVALVTITVSALMTAENFHSETAVTLRELGNKT